MKKKKAVRIALFILAVVVAVGAFTAGVLSLAHRENGYYDVGFTDAGNAILYPSGLHLYYYAEGSSNEIRRLINEVQKVYTSLALDTYKLLDASVTYEGTNNIASVNAAPNRWVSVSPALYGILESAYSHRTESYSPFAGALHKQWEVLRYLEEPESFDPLNDSDKRALLKKYAEWTAAPGAFDLLFDKTEGKVQLAVSDEYLAWAQENDIDAPVLDLNVLHDAYLLSSVSASLSARGYVSGYLCTDSGLSVYLNGAGKGVSLPLNAYDGEKEIAVAALDAAFPSAFLRFSAYAPAKMEYGYYFLEQEGKRVYRHLYPDIADGDYANQLMTLYLAADEDSIVDIACVCAGLNGLRTPGEIASFVAALPEGTFAAYTLQNDASKTLYVRESSAAKGLSLDPESGYKIKFIPS